MGNASNIFVAQMARVWLAPVGTSAPTGPTGVMPDGWREVGLFTPDSLSWATDPSFEEVRSHQSNFPTRRFQTEDAATAEVDLQEWTADNFKAVYGGGTVSQVSAGVFRDAPPAIGGRSEVAACIELIDGPRAYRRMVPRCEQAEGVEQTFERTSESTLPLRLSILGSDIGDPWYDLTNDPAFAPEPPTVGTITPATGATAGGTSVTIAGTGFTGATGVTVGGAAGTVFTVVSDTSITVTTPAGTAGAKDVVVLHPAGNATKVGGFTYA
mgnify:FL=1